MTEKLSKIDESKKKLAASFKFLEDVIEEKIKAQTSDCNLDDLMNKIELLEYENKKITMEYKELSKEYQKIQDANTEVIEDLDLSINFIEKLLEKESANN